MTEAKEKLEKNPSGNSRIQWLVIALAVYIVRLMPWAMAEFWYDEVLTLTDFSLDLRGAGLWQSVFRSYPVANNHILNSAFYWCWVRILNFGLSAEQVVRLPSILFGGCAIGIVICHWRKWLGDKIASLTGLLLAISPVFTAYAYQIRGYSLSMLLATIALSGAMEYLLGSRKTGMCLVCLCSLLLPLTIPSNAILLLPLALFLALGAANWRGRILAALPPLVCGALGASYYFTLWPQFVAASREPAGWDSPWKVCLNLLLALLAHALVLLVLPLAGKKSEETKDTSLAPFHPGALLASSAVVILATIFLTSRGKAPYPRVFLVFLTPVTLALVLFLRKSGKQISWMAALLLVLANGVAWERFTTNLTESQVAQGISPNSLLQQYYRGADGIRASISVLSAEGWLQNATLLTDEYDYPTANFYWALYNGPRGFVHQINLGIPEGYWVKAPFPKPQLWVIAKTPESAARLFEFAGLGDAKGILESLDKPNGMTRIPSGGNRALFLPPMPNPPKRQHPPVTPRQGKQTTI